MGRHFLGKIQEQCILHLCNGLDKMSLEVSSSPIILILSEESRVPHTYPDDMNCLLHFLELFWAQAERIQAMRALMRIVYACVPMYGNSFEKQESALPHYQFSPLRVVVSYSCYGPKHPETRGWQPMTLGLNPALRTIGSSPQIWGLGSVQHLLMSLQPKLGHSSP